MARTDAHAAAATRVFSIQFTGSASNPVFHPIGITGGNHDITHTGAAGQPQIENSMVWTMTQLGVFLGALEGAVGEVGSHCRKAGLRPAAVNTPLGRCWGK